jgi:superfamily I DNA/RNA helicase
MTNQGWTEKLSPQQRDVVDWVRNGNGSLNLIARAGCGKTYTLVRGAIRAIVEANLGDVALMAYNKAAAEEFKARLKVITEETGDARFVNFKNVEAGTVHSFGFRIVRKWSPTVKVDDGKCDAICDELYQQGRMGMVNVIFDREKSAILKLVSLGKQSAIGFLTGIEDRGAWYALVEHHAINELTDGTSIDDVVTAAIEVLRRSFELDRDVVDFDDMVIAPLVHKMRIWPKAWVLVDEAQDTNAARRCLALALLKPQTGRLIAVGDDRQAIYGFTGADSDALDLIATELSSSTLPLTVTYRCPKTVVAEANRLVPDLVAHETAPDGSVRYLLQTTNSRGPWFRVERPAITDAVLCRNTKPLIETAYGMLAAGIGCRVEGREIGNGLVKLATRWKRVTTLSVLDGKLEDYRAKEIAKWQAKGREDRAQATEDAVESLLAISRALIVEGKTTVADLVAWIRTLFGDTAPGERPRVVTLSTIHKAKGREWPTVYLLARNETLPSRWARKPWQLRQEENLEYVAITRAQRELVFVD